MKGACRFQDLQMKGSPQKAEKQTVNTQTTKRACRSRLPITELTTQKLEKRTGHLEKEFTFSRQTIKGTHSTASKMNGKHLRNQRGLATINNGEHFKKKETTFFQACKQSKSPPQSFKNKREHLRNQRDLPPKGFQKERGYFLFLFTFFQKSSFECVRPVVACCFQGMLHFAAFRSCVYCQENSFTCSCDKTWYACGSNIVK